MGGGKVISGRAFFFKLVTGQKVKCQDIVYGSVSKVEAGYAVMVQGPNLPPPPPPVVSATCPNTFNKTGCAKIHGCVWCTSSDDVHELCFTKGHTPKKDWSCDADEALIV